MSDKKPLIYTPRVPVLPEPSFSIPGLPDLKLPQMPAPRIVRPYQAKPNPFLDYNNDYQINSIADIIMTTFNPDMQRKPVYIGDTNISDIPILNIIPSAFQYVNDAYIEPIKQGQWGAVGLNTLQNFSETLDIFANPVKGYLMEGKQGFLDALGYGGGGRHNYDWNTGNIVEDIALELVSDPLNWVTLFGKGAISIAVKQMAKNGLRTLGEESGQILATKAYKHLAKTVAEEFMKGNDKNLAQVARTAAEVMMSKKVAPVQFTETFIKTLDKFNLDNTTAHILNGLNGIVRPTEEFEKQLFKTAVGVPYATGYLAVKTGNGVKQFFHKLWQDGLEPFKTPSGNIDVLQADKILEYTRKHNLTIADIMDLKEQIGPDTFGTLLKEAMLKEKDNVIQFLNTDLKQMPNINAEGKVQAFKEYLAENLHMSPELVINTLQDLNQDSNGRYQWLYDWVRNSLDLEKMQAADQRNKIWTKIKDIQTKLKEIKATSDIDRYAYFEQYLKEKYNTTPFDLLQEMKGYNIELGEAFSWLPDYFTKNLRQLEAGPYYEQKNELMQKVREIINTPKKLEAETRFKLLDAYVQKEHGIGVLDYINNLRGLNEKYPGIFQKYLDDLDISIKRLQLIDEWSTRYAGQQSAVEQVKKFKRLRKEQQDALLDLPQRTSDTLLQGYIRHFVQNGDEQAQLADMWRGLNPFMYEQYILKKRFTQDTVKTYIEQIKVTYDNYVRNEVLRKIYDPALFTTTDKDYKAVVRDIQGIFNKYWKDLKIELKRQIHAHRKQFYVENVFTNLQEDLTKYIDSQIPALADYEAKLAMINRPNKLMDFEAYIKKNMTGFREAYDKLIHFGSDERLEHLKDKLMYIERKHAATLGSFKDNQRAFFKDIADFFGSQPNKGPEEIIRSWFDTNTHNAGKDVHIYEEAFIKNFEEMFGAWGRKDFDGFLDAIDDIVFQLYAISMKSKDAEELIRPLYDIFTNYNLNNYSPLIENIQADEVWYKFKLEQNYVMSLLMADEELNGYINELMDSTSELGTRFKNMLLSGEPEAQILNDSLTSYLNYKAFLTDLYETLGNQQNTALPVDHDVLGAFLSTLQKYALRDPETLLNNLDNNFYYIIEQTEQQINSIEMPRNLSLDKLIPELEQNEKYRAFLIPLEAHHALDDAKRTWAVCDAELTPEFKKIYGDNVKVVHLDIETTGMNGNLHEIHEIGEYSPDLKLNKEYVIDLHNLGQKRAQVAETLRTPTEPVNDEQFMLKHFLDDLFSHTEDNIVLNLHNGSKFDRKFFLNRFQFYWEQAKASNSPTDMKYWAHAIAEFKGARFKFSDSLKMLQVKDGYTIISEENKTALYYALLNFVNAQKRLDRFIQPIDPSVAKQLKDLGEKLRLTLGEANYEIYSKYFEHASSIYSFFKAIASTNRELGRTLLKKSIFDDPLFQKYFGALNITQALGATDNEISDLVKPIDGVRQYGVKKVLDANAIMEYFEGTKLSNYQMEYRTDIAKKIDKEYSMLNHGTRLKQCDQNMRDILRIWIERARMSRAVPSDLMSLKVNQDYATNFAVLRMLFNYKSEAFKNIQVNTAQLQTGGIQKIFATNLLDGVCPDIIPGDIRELLENPELVRTRAFKEDGALEQMVDLEMQSIWQSQRDLRYAEQKIRWDETKAQYIDQQYQVYQRKAAAIASEDKAVPNYMVDTVTRLQRKLNLKDEMADYAAYYKATNKVLTDYTDLMGMLNNLGKSWDTNGVHRAVVQVRATSARPMFDLLKAVRDRHAKITDVETHFKQIMKYREFPDALMRQQINNTLTLTDDTLFAHLIHGARRLIVIDTFEADATRLQKFLTRTKDLEQKKIHTILEKDKLYIVLDPSVRIDVMQGVSGKVKYLADGKTIDPPKLSVLDYETVANEIFDNADAEIKQNLLKVYDKLYNLIGDYDTGYSSHIGTIAELTTREYYREVYEVLPDSIKRLLPHKDLVYHEKYFNGASFNHSILGSSSFRQQFHQYTPSDIISVLNNMMTLQIQHLKSHMEYMNMFFDETLSIKNGILNTFSEQDLLNALKNSPEYRLVGLIKDTKKGAQVVDLNPQTIGDIKKAKELNAVLMSYQTYSTAFGAINSFSMRHSKLNMFHKINYLYKAGYILTPGAFVRNVIDSVMKNYIAASDDTTGITRSFLTAYQLYWRYRHTARDLIKYSEGRITSESTTEFFNSGISKLSKEVYDFLHGFDVDGPSGGQIREFEQYFLHGKQYGLDGVVKQTINTMMEPTKVVEQICRLAEYMWAIEKGMPSTKAYQLIAKTHFDYTIKNDLDRLLELIFPFYTFTMNNIEFWLDAFDRIPALASILRDVYTPIWNQDEYTPDQMKYNRSLQYQLLSGNLPLTKSGMTLKLNPSFMDVYNLATDPINAIKGKLNPLMQAGIAYGGAGIPEEMKYAYGIPVTSTTPQQAILELLPIAGPIINRMFEQGPKYYARTGNALNAMLPSLFGATAKSQPFKGYQSKPFISYPKYSRAPRKGYYRKTYGKRKWPKKTYAKKVYATRYYPKKVWSSVGYSVDNFYNKLYNKSTGKSRLKALMIPVTGQTLKYRLKDLYYYYK